MTAFPVPVTIITGFLGSGKTTLLSRLLASPAMADTAVIINEFGEVGLDHQLIESANDDIVLLSSGCLCCTIRNDFVDTMRRLFEKREKGEVTRFQRVLIETTGLADPGPLLHTLMDDRQLGGAYSVQAVIATVDAVHADGELDQHFECAKQIAVADRLVLTKTDIAPADCVRTLLERIRRVNPAAPVVTVVHGAVEAGELLGDTLRDTATASRSVRQWLRADRYIKFDLASSARIVSGADASRLGRHHDERIRAYCLVYEDPLDWRYFSPNLASLVSRHAEKLLRVKGILNVIGEPAPVVVHGVQHQFHRLRLSAWPDHDRRSKLVLITQDLDRALLVDWLKPNGLAQL